MNETSFNKVFAVVYLDTYALASMPAYSSVYSIHHQKTAGIDRCIFCWICRCIVFLKGIKDVTELIYFLLKKEVFSTKSMKL